MELETMTALELAAKIKQRQIHVVDGVKAVFDQIESKEETVHAYLDLYKKEAYAPYINPECSDITEYLPPVFMVTSRNDNLRRYTTDFAMALKKHNACHKLINFPKKSSLTHAFSVFEPFLDESSEVIDMMTEYLRKF